MYQKSKLPPTQGYIVRFGQCSVFLIPINKIQPLEISVVLSRWGRCTVVNSAPIVKRSWNQEKYTLPWPCPDPASIIISIFLDFSISIKYYFLMSIEMFLPMFLLFLLIHIFFSLLWLSAISYLVLLFCMFRAIMWQFCASCACLDLIEPQNAFMYYYYYIERLKCLETSHKI
jgi:hypothetical protein